VRLSRSSIASSRQSASSSATSWSAPVSVRIGTSSRLTRAGSPPRFALRFRPGVVIDQHVPHGGCGEREKVGAVVPADPVHEPSA
jgi:hypothetical protein